MWAPPQLLMGLGLAWPGWLKLCVTLQWLCLQGDGGNLTGPLGQDTTLLLRKFPLKKLSWNPINRLEGRHGQPSSGLINNRTCPALEEVSLFSELKGRDKPSQQEEMGTTPTTTPSPSPWNPSGSSREGSLRQRPRHPPGWKRGISFLSYATSCKFINPAPRVRE